MSLLRRNPISTLLLLHNRRISTLPHLNTRKQKKKKKTQSPRTKPVQQEPALVNPTFESILHSDAKFRFLTRTKDFLSRQPDRVLLLDLAGKLHRELGFPRGRKLPRFALLHPLLLSLYRHPDPPSSWLGFTPLMDRLIEEEDDILNAVETDRVRRVRKLLMMARDHRIPLAKLHHCRHVFGLPFDFRDRVKKYPEFFDVVVNEAGNQELEIVEWDPVLAVSKLEEDFVLEEDRVRKTIKFPVPHSKSLGLPEDERRQMDSVTTFPLVSPYSDGSRLDLWTVEAEKYRVGVIHEFLSLTLEKRASIHHIVEFKEEFCLTRHTYDTLKKQQNAFYLAGTEMNWTVFLREGYSKDGTLLQKDPLVVFNEKLRRYACMSEEEFRKEAQELGEDMDEGRFLC